MTGIRKAIVTPRCVQSWCAFGPCMECEKLTEDGPAHLAGGRLLCAECCCGAGLFSELPAEAFAGIEKQKQGSLF
jgi:hypothetical protein